MGLAINVEGVTKRFGRQRALEGLRLQVEAGVAFGLIGPNGAGKTTFIKVLLGICRPDAGRVQVLGGAPEAPSVRRRIGYLPERLTLPRAWPPLAFLASVARLKGLRPGRGELLRLLERVGLASSTARPMGAFSKGMKQRVGLAAALLGAPELLILDEPTDGVDPLGRVAIRALLQEELQRGATLFLNSHLLAETERLCTRVGVLAGGKVVQEGALSALRQGGDLFEVRFAPGAPVDALLALGFTPSGAEGTFHLRAEGPAALNAALDQARAQGALLVALSQQTRDLEQVLAEAVA